MSAVTAAGQVDDVRLDSEMTWALLTYLGGARSDERGGVLLGLREEREVRIFGAVFPPQLARSYDRCAFDVNSIEVIRRAVAALADHEISRILGTIVGWVHSHPGHGLFLSNTDVDTLESWVQLDSRAIAVVVDPFLRAYPRRRIAWWDQRCRARHVVLSPPGPDAVTMTQASSIAKAIRDNASPRGSWDLVTSGCIVRVIPALGREQPDVGVRGGPW